MNIYQKISALFGRQYVFLVLPDDELVICHAYNLVYKMFAHPYNIGYRMFAHPYLPRTRAELLPGGKIGKGPIYVHGWHPITDKTFELFDRKEQD